jgi:hypothetical protein
MWQIKPETTADSKMEKDEMIKKKLRESRVPVAHACNLNNSGGSWFKASPGK